MSECQVILFPAKRRSAEQQWLADIRDRVLAEGEWTRRIAAEFKARARKPYRPLLLSAWTYHVGRWRAEYQQCAPSNVPWKLLWTAFLVECPEARRHMEHEGCGG